MKNLLLTHTDLDGVSCAVIAKVAGLENLTTIFVDNDKIDELIEEYIEKHINTENFLEYDNVYITDLPIKEETAYRLNQLIDSYVREGTKPNIEEPRINTKFVYLDHHKTSLSLNQYDWAMVQCSMQELFSKEEKPICGTKLFARYLTANNVQFSNETEQYIENVNDWDTWLWQKTNNEEAESLSLLLGFVPRDMFIEQALQLCDTGHASVFANDLIACVREKRTTYIEEKIKEAQIITLRQNKFISVRASQHVSLLGNKLAEMYKDDCAGAIIISDYGLSFRGVRSDIDMSEYAKLFGGGGHQKAAGASFDNEYNQRVINELLNATHCKTGD